MVVICDFFSYCLQNKAVLWETEYVQKEAEKTRTKCELPADAGCLVCVWPMSHPEGFYLHQHAASTHFVY